MFETETKLLASEGDLVMVRVIVDPRYAGGNSDTLDFQGAVTRSEARTFLDAAIDSLESIPVQTDG